MIHLTRLNNQPLVVNADMIKFIENAPDTVITLITGEKLVVRESADQIVERVREFRQFSSRPEPAIASSTSTACQGSTAAATISPAHKPPDDKQD